MIRDLGRLVAQGDLGGAIRLARERLADDPLDAGALTACGAVHLLRGDCPQAVHYLRRAVRAAPEVASHWANLGCARLQERNYHEAARLLERARRLSPAGAFSFTNEHTLAHTARAAELRQAGRPRAALHALYSTLRLRPDADAWSDAGTIYSSLGRPRAAQRCFRRALELRPEDNTYRSNLAVSYLYRADLSPAAIGRGHIELFAGMPGQVETGAKPKRRSGPLRVGYLAADFRLRPLVFFLLSVLRRRNSSEFVTICYSNTHKEDEYTTMIGELTDEWRDIRGLDDDAAAALVRADAVDILLDCTGHFERGRPGIFARRPASVQAILLGYPATTGVPGIATRIVDGVTDPPGETEGFHSERLARLPGCYACYTPPEQYPDAGPLPARRRGYVTFGCAQKRNKISARMLGVWAEILKAAPDSRLAFHHVFAGGSREFRAPIERYFERRGIAADRLEWYGPAGHYEHLRRLAEFDIALDTYPFNGMATTCECLWMGVPVVTMAGSAHLSRVGLSLLTALGAREWAAASEEEYLGKAVALAGDWTALEQTRSGLRARMQSSPLTDSGAYTERLETALRSLWEERLAQEDRVS